MVFPNHRVASATMSLLVITLLLIFYSCRASRRRMRSFSLSSGCCSLFGSEPLLSSSLSLVVSALMMCICVLHDGFLHLMCFISVLPRSDKTVLHLTSVDSFHFQFADSLSRFQNETTVRSKISESATRSGNSLTYFADRDPKPLGEIHMLALLLQKAVLCRNLFPEKRFPHIALRSQAA